MRSASAVALMIGVLGLTIQPVLAQSATGPVVGTINVPVTIEYLPLTDPQPSGITCAAFGVSSALGPIADGSTSFQLVKIDATTRTAGYSSFSGTVSVQLYARAAANKQTGPPPSGESAAQAAAITAIQNSNSYVCQLVLPISSKSGTGESVSAEFTTQTSRPLTQPTLTVNGSVKK